MTIIEQAADEIKRMKAQHSKELYDLRNSMCFLEQEVEENRFKISALEKQLKELHDHMLDFNKSGAV
jgi:chromosome segregation ATPase